MAVANKSLTLEAPTPTNISTNSEPEIWKKGTWASPATALANNVFPVPGGPINRTPLGILAPIFRNFFGFLRKSTTSSNSSLASSKPATSLKVILSLGWPSAPKSLALALEKLKACMAPDLACRKINQKKSPKINKGNSNKEIGPSQNIIPLSSFDSTSTLLRNSWSIP